jgi:hypothetical protein
VWINCTVSNQNYLSLESYIWKIHNNRNVQFSSFSPLSLHLYVKLNYCATLSQNKMHRPWKSSMLLETHTSHSNFCRIWQLQLLRPFHLACFPHSLRNKGFRAKFIKSVFLLHIFSTIEIYYIIVFILVYAILLHFYEELITSVLILSVLNLLDITSKFLIVNMFVIVDLLT